jgi:hypothetical protein
MKMTCRILLLTFLLGLINPMFSNAAVMTTASTPITTSKMARKNAVKQHRFQKLMARLAYRGSFKIGWVIFALILLGGLIYLFYVLGFFSSIWSILFLSLLVLGFVVGGKRR